MGKVKTKAYIKNVRTGVIKQFLFNPSNFGDSHNIVYSGIASPGSSYPTTHFISGDSKTFSITLFLYDREGEKIKDYVRFLNDFIPIAKTGVMFQKPPTLIFAFGWYVKECVMENLSVAYDMFDEDLNPTMGTATLQLRAIG